MIARRLHPPGLNYTAHLVTAFVQVPIGASGAPGTHVGKGIVVTRTGAGAYTATLQKVQNGVGAIVKFHVDVVRNDNAGYSAHAKVMSASAGTVTFVTEADAALGTPADPPSGSFLLVEMVVRDASTDAAS